MSLYVDFLAKFNQPLYLSALAGLLLALSHTFAFMAPAVLVGIALFVLALIRTSSYQQALFVCMLFGTLKASGGYVWMLYAYPITALDTHSTWMQLSLIGSYWLGTAFFMGVGMMVLSLVYFLRHQKLLLLLILPIVWLLAEVTGSLVVSVWFLGPGGFINAYTAHGYAGLPLINFAWALPVAAIGGLYGLTFLVALVGALLALWVRDRKSVLYPLLMLSLVSVSALGSNWLPDRQSLGMTVLSIETEFPSDIQKTREGAIDKTTNVREALRFSLQDSQVRSDVILLPEDSRFTTGFNDPDLALDYLKALAPDSSALVVDSARVNLSREEAVLRGFYYDLSSDNIYRIDKRLLTPQGEYTTYPFRALLRLVGQENILTKYDANQNYVPGPYQSYEDLPVDLPRILFCLENSSTLEAKRLSLSGESPILLHTVSHAWFSDLSILKYQLSSMLRIHAVWTGKTIITAGNKTESLLYHPDGTIERGEVISGQPLWRVLKYQF